MKPGDLVRVVRKSILVPSDQIGMVTEAHPRAGPKAYQPKDGVFLCLIRLIGGPANGQIVRVLARDLEVL